MGSPDAIHRRRIAFAKVPRQKAGPVFLLRAPCEIHPPVILEEDLRHRIRKGARVEILEDLIEPRDQDFTGPGEQRGLLPSKIELLDFFRTRWSIARRLYLNPCAPWDRNATKRLRRGRPHLHFSAFPGMPSAGSAVRLPGLLENG